MTFLLLYLRSRLVLPAVAAIVALATAYAIAHAHEEVTPDAVPILAAVIMIATVSSPDPEWEQSLPTRWWRVRTVHTALGIIVATAILWCVLPGALSLRNTLGFTGLAAAVAVILGAWRTWMVLLPYTLLVTGLASGAEHTPKWAWFVRPDTDMASWWIAAGAGILGIALLVRYGARTQDVSSE